MSPFFFIVVRLSLIALFITIALCLYRLALGPKAADRAVAFDTISSVFVGIICVLCIKWASTLYFDAVWILMLLGFLGSVSIAKYLVQGRIF